MTWVSWNSSGIKQKKQVLVLKQTTIFTQIDVNALTWDYKRLIIFNELDDGPW